MTWEYNRYIKSAEWMGKRLERLTIDGFECRTCTETDRTLLEVHHRTYDRLGDEDVDTDLITLCRACHEAITSSIRARRYAGRTYKPTTINEGKINHVARKRVSPEISVSVSDAQRPTRRPAESFHKGYEAYLGEVEED